MTIPSYATGTASIASGGTTVTITGGVLTGNARELDFVVINGVLAGPILAIADATHLTVPKWGGAAQTNVAYAIYQVAQRSSADTSVTDDLRKQVAALNFQGFPVLVPATSTVPDPSLGDEGQFAVQFLPALAWWQKTGGLWVASGGPIRGYGGTSTTSLPLSVASKSFTTQANLAYLVGSRVRLSNDSTHYMEGPVTAYDATTGAMTVNVGRVTGSGTFAAWNLSIVGDFAGGDMLAANNLGDVASIPSARGVLGADGMVTVRCIATSNVAIASALINGASIDGVTVATNDRVLLAGQTAPAENGVYIVAASGAASRSAAFNTYDSMCGYFFSIREGTVYADTLWQCTSDRGGTLGTTAIVFRNPRPSIYAAPFDALAYNGMQINGSLDVSQEYGNTAFSIASGVETYAQDCWTAKFNRAATLSFGVYPQYASVPAGFQNALLLNTSAGLSTLAAGDYATLNHLIEGYRVSRLDFGKSTAQSVTIGFWVNCPVAGTMAVTLQNAAANRSYITNVVINVAGAWEYKTLTIPGDTSGTWLNTNGLGLRIIFCFGSGSTNQGTPNQWNADGKFATSSTTNQAATTSNNVLLTGLIVVPGNEVPSSTRSPFIMRPYDQEFLLSQRYYQFLIGADPDYLAICQAYNSTAGLGVIRFQSPFRVAPSCAVSAASDFEVYSSAGADITLTSVGFQQANTRQVRINIGVAGGLTGGAAALLRTVASSNGRMIANGRL